MNSTSNSIFEEAIFNDAAYAKDIMKQSEERLKRVKIGLIISVVASICGFISFTHGSTHIIFEVIGFVAFVGAIASYVIGGGFMDAIRMALKIGKIGWLIMPFPVDIVTGIISTIFSLVAFFLLPVIFVSLNYIQTKKDYEAAENYLSYCRTE